MLTCHWLDLESLGSWPTMPKNFPGTWAECTSMFKIDAFIWVLFWRALKSQPFSWRVGSNLRRQSKNIEMECKTHIKLVWYIFLAQCEKFIIKHLTLLLLAVTMPYACWFLWQADYIEDFKWRPHFPIWDCILKGLFWERYILKGQIAFEGHWRVQSLNTCVHALPQWSGRTGSWLQMNKVEFEKQPVEVEEYMISTDQFRRIYRIYPNLTKENQRMWTCNQLDL